MHRVHFNHRIERLVPRRVGVVVVHHHHHRRRLRNRVDAISIGVHHRGRQRALLLLLVFGQRPARRDERLRRPRSLVFERVPSFLRRHDDDDDLLLLLLLLPLSKRFVAFKDDGRHKTEGERVFCERRERLSSLFDFSSLSLSLSLSLFLSFATTV